MIIALEGGIYAGKSSVAKELKKDLHFEVIPELMDTLTKKQKSSILNLNENERFSRFLVFERYRKKKLSNSPNSNLILDRSFLTLFAFEVARGRHHNLMELFHKHHKNLIIPDKIYFLDVSDIERMRRIGSDKDRLISCLYSPKFNQKVKSFFQTQSFVPNIEFINTTKLSIEDVKLNILQTMNKKDKNLLLTSHRMNRTF